MPAWIERPRERKFPWIQILVPAGLGVVALVVYWTIRYRTPQTSFIPGPPTPSVILSSGTIGSEGSLSESMRQSGILPLEAVQVERTLRPYFNPKNSREEDRFEITRSTSGHFMGMTYWHWPNTFEYFTVTRSTTGVFQAASGKVSTTESLVGVSGTIQDSLSRAMTRQGVSQEMVNRLADIFGSRIDFLTEPRVGDTYKMIWKQHSGNNTTKDGDIICAIYQGQETGDVYAYRLAGDYFDAAGNGLRGQFLRAPLVYRRISSYFTEHRFHPILRISRPHHGIDYAAPFGTPASSIADGVVIAKGWEGGLGNEIRVRHSGSYVSIYGHLRGYPRGIHIGSHVKQGQVIGYVGSTGLSTGPHLHFGFERDGHLINFFKLRLNNTRKSVPSPERQHFEQIKKEAFALLAQLTQPGGRLQTFKSN